MPQATDEAGLSEAVHPAAEVDGTPGTVVGRWSRVMRRRHGVRQVDASDDLPERFVRRYQTAKDRQRDARRVQELGYQIGFETYSGRPPAGWYVTYVRRPAPRGKDGIGQ